MTPFPLDIPPGVVKVDSDYSQSGRYIDAQWVRFSRGRAEKIGGWTKFTEEQFTGTVRTVLAFIDNAESELYALGSECKLELMTVDRTFTNITPIDDSGTLGTDPFTTTSGSDIVTVNDTNHGRQTGDTVDFSGATAVGGITVDGEYIVQSIPDPDNFTIQHSSAASSSATGGGASVSYSYELSCGLLDGVYGGGFGVGTYGTSTYGTARTDGGFFRRPRVWYLEPYGEDVLAMPSGGNLYRYDTSAGGRAAIVANAPTNNIGFFLTDERFVVVLGSDGDPMQIAWADQDDITDWTPTATNTANIRQLTAGSRLVAGSPIQNRQSLIWSDTSVYEMLYTGSSAILETRRRGSNCGLVGPNAYVVVNGIAYWLAADGHFHMYSGNVRNIPNQDDIRDWVNLILNQDQKYKVVAGYNRLQDEAWWIFPTGTNEPDTYLMCNLETYEWTNGTITRTAWTNQVSGDPSPLKCGTDNYIYQHETGLDGDGQPIEWFLEHAPIDIDNGSATMDVDGLKPDFQRHTGTINMTITCKDYPEDENNVEVAEERICEGDGMVDLWLSGRQIGIRFQCNESGSDFRLGRPYVRAERSGTRR